MPFLNTVCFNERNSFRDSFVHKPHLSSSNILLNTSSLSWRMICVSTTFSMFARFHSAEWKQYFPSTLFSWAKSPVRTICMPPKGFGLPVIILKNSEILSMSSLLIIEISSMTRISSPLIFATMNGFFDLMYSASSRAVFLASPIPRYECIVLPRIKYAAHPVDAVTPISSFSEWAHRMISPKVKDLPVPAEPDKNMLCLLFTTFNASNCSAFMFLTSINLI